MPAIPMPREVDALDAHREAMAREEPYFEGLRAGLLGLPISLNPYSDGIGRAEWARGWRQGTNERARAYIECTERARKLAAELRARAKKCLYYSRECDCGGRGLCLDVA